jgi:hypothetical protein
VPTLLPVCSPAYKRQSYPATRAPPPRPSAIAAATVKLPVRPPPPPAKLLHSFPRTYRSFHDHLFACISPPLAGFRAEAGALPLIGAVFGQAATANQHQWAQSHLCVACWSSPTVLRRRRAPRRWWGHGCNSRGYSCEPRDLDTRIWNLVF